VATTRVIISGPIFSGAAAQAAAEFTDSLAGEVAEIGATWIKLDTERMDRSGRGGTGRAAGGVQITGGGSSYTIRGGIREGEYSWPWLEGTSPRNASTGFKGYGSFRRTRLRMRKQIRPYAEAELAAYIIRMGGAAE
jgi:hypothetical protein